MKVKHIKHWETHKQSGGQIVSQKCAHALQASSFRTPGAMQTPCATLLFALVLCAGRQHVTDAAPGCLQHHLHLHSGLYQFCPLLACLCKSVLVAGTSDYVYRLAFSPRAMHILDAQSCILTAWYTPSIYHSVVQQLLCACGMLKPKQHVLVETCILVCCFMTCSSG